MLAGLRLKVKVFPKSSRSEIVEKDGILKAYVKSAPEADKANKELIELIAIKRGIKKNCVTIVSGLRSRNKIVEVRRLAHG